jgi:hypothetical protein
MSFSFGEKSPVVVNGSASPEAVFGELAALRKK